MKAILLAAGFSTRMGQLKQVMHIGDKPMVRQIAEALLAAGLDLVVVLGHERERVKAALDGLSCEYAINALPEDGMFSSVKIGCQAIPPGETCLMTTCDCPGIRPDTIRQVVHALEREQTKVIIPIFQGRRGHPVGLPAFLVTRIKALPKETPGLNSLWRDQPDLVFHLEIDDAAVLRDFDRPEDVRIGEPLR